MAHEAIRYTWYCPHCQYPYHNREEFLTHVANCKKNVANKHCAYCIYACYLGDDRYITYTNCYCKYYEKKYTQRPYNIDCEKEINENGKLKPIPHTCHHWSYKGYYHWTPFDEYEEAKSRYEAAKQNGEIVIPDAPTDYIVTSDTVWLCDYCNDTRYYYTREDLAIEHEHKYCHRSPYLKECETCIHGELRENEYGRYIRDNKHMAAWCSAFNQSVYYDKPYFNECDETSNIYNEKVKLKHTCKKYIYKGAYGFQVDEGECE